MNGFTACCSLLAGASSSSSRQEPVDPQAVHAREVRMTPVAPHVQLHEPEHPLLMVLRDSRSRWMSSAGSFYDLVTNNMSHANGDSYLQFEGLHRVPVLVVEKSSEFGPFVV